jgi:peptidoglycan hydrolase CwlO-like protein
MRVPFMLVVVSIIVGTSSSCISNKKYAALLNEKQGTEILVSRLRQENNELTNEKFAANSYLTGKVERLESVQQKCKTECMTMQQKYDLLQQQHAQLTEDLRKKTEEAKTLQARVNMTLQENEKQTEVLREKLRWVYMKYNVRKSN